MADDIVACSNCGKKNRLHPVSKGVPGCASCHQLLPWLVDAGAGSFDAEIRASVPVVVDFWAAWCGPCRMIAPLLEESARRYAGQLKVVKLNVDEDPEIAARFGVQGIPLMVVLRDGREVDRRVGAAPPAQIDAWLKPHLGAPAGAA